jgi:ubiquinone/menaquinone biosynthesis C-methylase UbiE
VTFIWGDAQRLLVEKAAFDAVVFNLVLSVIPDGRACLHENLRALKPGGRAVVFDKFAPEAGYISIGRQVLNVFSTIFGTDITRKFGGMLRDSGAKVVCQEASIFRGKYQIFLLKKK